jgi:chromosome segregation ATPase
MSVSVARPSKGSDVSRERLKFFAGEVDKAHEAIEDLEQRIARLNAIIFEADEGQRRLQRAIEADNGVSLAKYSAGEAKPTEDITKLVSHAQTSSEAATAAKVALPTAQAALENARGQLLSLNEQKNAELNRVLANLADEDARAYDRAFSEACRMHDKLVGYANVAQSTIGDIQLIVENPKMPRFALPSLGNQDADPFMRHSVSPLTVAASTRKWSSIRARLEHDVMADISDLI